MPRKPEASPEEINVLLVEDNAAERRHISRQLKAQGFQFTAIDTGQKAIDLIQHDDPHYDVLLLNLILPGMDGNQTLEKLKEINLIDTLPILMIGKQDETGALVKCIEIGADDYIRSPIDPVLLRIRILAVVARYYVEVSERERTRKVEREKQLADDLLNIVIPIGVAMSAEKNFRRLLEMILLEAKRMCNADGGTLYLRTPDDQLKFMVMRNDTLSIQMGGAQDSELDIPFPPLHLVDSKTGQPNHKNVATHVALTGQTFNIADAYNDADEFDFSGTLDFDKQSNYRSTSFLTAPLKNAERRVIGVLQLINAKDPRNGQVVPFDPGLQTMIESLSTLATVALESYEREENLRKQIEELRIEIDEVRRKSQVAEVTQTAQFQAIKLKAKALREEATRDG